ncbi:MAG: M1 family metallopeptidase, partial [Metallosphaera sp.]
MLDFFSDKIGVEYPWPKYAQVCCYGFGGGMENTSATTLTERTLHDDRAHLDEDSDGLVAHELAHQWFGNLVTMKWWNDLWLNESFATFMSYKIIDMLHSDWYMWGEFLLDETAGALLKDSIPTTHPIETKVNSPEEVEQIFDDISYGKGASILRMIESYIGKDEFRRGISKYLQKFSYGNAEGKDLWNSLEEASGKPVSKIMPHWVLEDGYPMV